MDRTREKEALASKLARCRELAEEFRDGPTAEMIHDLEMELREKIMQLEQKS